MYCYYCGKEIKDDSRFCIYCGTEQNRKAPDDADRAQRESVDRQTVLPQVVLPWLLVSFFIFFSQNDVGYSKISRMSAAFLTLIPMAIDAALGTQCLVKVKKNPLKSMLPWRLAAAATICAWNVIFISSSFAVYRNWKVFFLIASWAYAQYLVPAFLFVGILYLIMNKRK